MRSPVVRDGLGYRLDDPASGVSIRVGLLHQSSGEGLAGRLTVTRAPDGHLFAGRFNLESGTTRTSMAKALAERSRDRELDWRGLLETLCLGVLEAEEEGAAFVSVGLAPVRPEPPYLLRPCIFVDKPTIVFGEGGVGKSSTVAAAMAVSVATGRSALPGAWLVVRPGPVLVLDWEGDDGDWNDAISRIAAGMGIAPPEVHYRPMTRPLDESAERTAAFVQSRGIVLMVIDSVTWAMRTSERGSVEEPAKRMFDALRAIGCASLLIDHKSKASIRDEDSTGSAPIGAVVKTNKARATYELRASGGPDADGTRHLALIARKLNPTAPQPPVGIGVRIEGHRTTLALEDVRLEDAVTASAAARDGVLWQRIRMVIAASGGALTTREVVARLQLGGRDPMRQVEQAMTRKPAHFANDGAKDRYQRRWMVVGDPRRQTAEEPEAVAMWPEPQQEEEAPMDDDPFGDLTDVLQ